MVESHLTLLTYYLQMKKFKTARDSAHVAKNVEEVSKDMSRVRNLILRLKIKSRADFGGTRKFIWLVFTKEFLCSARASLDRYNKHLIFA